MATKNQQRTIKGGVGVAAAIVITWAISLGGVDVPGEVTAAIGSIIGSLVAYFKE